MTRSSSKPNVISPIAPQQKLSALHTRFGEPHLLLAYHSALLLVITPDLMYRLWATFHQDSHGVPLNIPWIAVSDFLLNVPNRELGKESYRLDAAVRRDLLIQLRQHPRLGQPRLREIAAFILAHIQPQLISPNPKIRHAAEAQRWTALAYAQPDLAAQELATALANLSPHDITEWRRLTTLIESLATELTAFQPLLTYATAMKHFVCFTGSDATATAKELCPVLDAGNQLAVAGINLPIPEAVQANFPRPVPVKVAQDKTPWLMGFSMAALIVAMGLGINQFGGLMRGRSLSLPSPIVALFTKPASSQNTLVMYVYQGLSPYQEPYKGEKNSTITASFSIDVAKYITNKLSIELEVQNDHSTVYVPALKGDKSVMAGINPDFYVESMKTMNFSTPYYEYRNYILFKKGRNITTEKNLAQKRVGAAPNSLEDDYLVYINRMEDIILAKGGRAPIPTLMQAIKIGRIDAAIIGAKDLRTVELTANSTRDFDFIENRQSFAQYRFAFPKGSKHLTEFNRIIQEMKRNGELERLERKWFDEAVAKRQAQEERLENSGLPIIERK